jgi:thiamine pyrophosphate-dependent acetolactate synthase large subunit-like protein
MQETATASGVDLTGIARACGFRLAATIRDEGQLEAALPQIHGAPGPCFFTIKVRAEWLPLVLPPKDGSALKLRFRRALLGEGAA